MLREALVVACGQAGIQLGDAVWRSHCVLADGKNTDTLDDGSFRCIFEETNGGLFVPRNLSFDLEPNVIDDIRNGILANLFHREFLLNGKMKMVGIILEEDIILLVKKLLIK